MLIEGMKEWFDNSMVIFSNREVDCMKFPCFQMFFVSNSGLYQETTDNNNKCNHYDNSITGNTSALFHKQISADERVHLLIQKVGMPLRNSTYYAVVNGGSTYFID